jgi:tetratricopeptide (TPR) repeat protein
MKSNPEIGNLLARRLFGAIGVLVLVGLTFVAARSGVAALFIASAEQSDNIHLADKALNLSPHDPDAHLLRAQLLESQNDLKSAIAEYELAAQLRPEDYVLWIVLARARELNDDREGALAAARNAVSLAPFYAQGHWQLGNLLVRAGEISEGFNELRLATQSNPGFLPPTIDLAAQLSRGDTELVRQLIQPQTPQAFTALITHFRRRGEFDEAMAILEAAGKDSLTERERGELITELIRAKRFKEAFKLWCDDKGLSIAAREGVIDNAGFEEEASLQEPGFGWRVDGATSTISRTLDAANPRQGSSSLRIDFDGPADPGVPIISQLVKTEHRTNYQLSFSFRSEELVSGGLPRLLVIDERTNNLLAQTESLPRNSNGWKDVTIDFVSGDGDAAARLMLKRESCPQPACPIFGRLWLDSFVLRKR